MKFANVRARYKEFPDDVGATSGQAEVMDVSEEEIEQLADAQRVLRDLAAQMRAFTENEPLAMCLVRLRYNPWRASAGLIGLSNSYDTYGGSKAFHKKEVQLALRIKP